VLHVPRFHCAAEKPGSVTQARRYPRHCRILDVTGTRARAHESARARASERAWVRDAPAGNASLPVARWGSITRMNRSFLSTDILRLPLRTGSEALDRSLVFSGVAIKRLMSRCVSERSEHRDRVSSPLRKDRSSRASEELR